MLYLQVEIYIKYIDSTVVLRQVASRYLSVGIRIPELVLNGTREGSDFLRQLCLDSCPVSERVDLSKLLLDISQGTPRQRSSYAAAQASCRDKAVTDFFFDSCVFDVLMTGESSFVSMAHSAYDDVRKFSSRQPRWTNRTNIVSYTEPSVAARSRTDRSGVTSSAAYSNTSLVRTLLFVYVMYVSYH
ncbi:RGMB [Bugula neritina]|uniref:RGMB n=1 Tax=Bugula neritina TaxID=10212 RepID=A0A7J7KBU2_BUGNE|nr:RGMB [Bugula neritina]